ncbi:hypothetical protein ACE6H2_024626 [Prunus campanulata]
MLIIRCSFVVFGERSILVSQFEPVILFFQVSLTEVLVNCSVFSEPGFLENLVRVGHKERMKTELLWIGKQNMLNQ